MYRSIPIAVLACLLVGCGPDRSDLQMKVESIQRQLERQVRPSDATLVRGIAECSQLILSEPHGNPLSQSGTPGMETARDAEIYRYRHLGAVFLSNVSDDQQARVAQGYPAVFPDFDPRHPESALEILQENP